MAKAKKNKAVKILAIVLAVIVVLVLGRNIFIKAAVKTGAKAVVGLGVTMDKFDLGLFKSYVHIENVQVKNPKGFAEPLMVDIPEVYIDYHLGNILGGVIHLEEVRFNMTEFYVVKQVDGTLNLDSITALTKGDKSTDKEEDKPAKDKSKKEMPDFRVDNLDLKIGKVIFVDYSKGDEPKISEYKINIDEHHENIKNPEALISLIVFKALFKTPIAGMANINLGGLQDTFTSGIGAVTGAAGKTLDSVSDTSKKALEDTSDTIKDAGSKLKGIFEKIGD